MYHVHGIVFPKRENSSVEDIVLSENDYHRVYSEVFDWSNVEQLHALSRCTCFFIGLSLNDPNLRRLLEIAQRDSSKSVRHYVFLERKSAFDENRPFDLWTQDNVWIGLFDVQWLFIKDIPFKLFGNILITMKDGEIKPIYKAKDTQEIPYDVAKIMIEKIENYQNSNTILEHFEYYDLRQNNYEKNASINKNKIIQNKI